MKHFLRAQMQRWPFEELAKVVGRLRLSGAQFARMVVSGVSAVADRFESEQARAFVTGPAMHADLPPEAPGTGIYALLLSMLGQRFGMPVVEGGTGRITDALAAKARGDGVEILTGRRVGRIVVERGRAVAVEAGGDTVSARRAVICASRWGSWSAWPGRSRSRPRPWPRSATTGPASAPSRSTGRSTVRCRGRPRSAGGPRWSTWATR